MGLRLIYIYIDFNSCDPTELGEERDTLPVLFITVLLNLTGKDSRMGVRKELSHNSHLYCWPHVRVFRSSPVAPYCGCRLSETSFDNNTTYRGRGMGIRKTDSKNKDVSENTKAEM